LLGPRLRVVIVPALAAVAYVVVDKLDSGNSLLGALDAGARRALFASAAATTGALLGFPITGVTILLTVGQGPRMMWLRGKALFRRDVRFVFFSAIVGLATSTFAFLMLIAVATERHFPLSWGLVAAAATALTMDRLWRLISFLDALMRVALVDAEKPTLQHPAFDEPMQAE